MFNSVFGKAIKMKNIPGMTQYNYEKENTIPSVYFLCKGGIPVYIGATKNLPQRLKKHPIKPFKYEEVYYLPTPPRLLFKIEQNYIKQFNPKYNVMHTTNTRCRDYPVKMRCYNYRYFREIVSAYQGELENVFFKETISNWNAGIQKPSAASVQRLCEALGIRRSDLLEEIPQKGRLCHI